jgi:hypothetical protein
VWASVNPGKTIVFDNDHLIGKHAAIDGIDQTARLDHRDLWCLGMNDHDRQNANNDGRK